MPVILEIVGTFTSKAKLVGLSHDRFMNIYPKSVLRYLLLHVEILEYAREQHYFWCNVCISEDEHLNHFIVLIRVGSETNHIYM
jgi:hypothetical protein